MNTSRYFKLGLFVLIGAGTLVGTVLAVGAGRLLEKHIIAETWMDASVNGLDTGSPVKYRGVTIGHVTAILFAAEQNGGLHPEKDRIARYVLIRMSLDSSSFRGMSLEAIRNTLKTMTRAGLRARVEQQGIGGGVYVGLDFLDPKVGPPPSPSQVRLDSTAIYIPSAPGTMEQVMSAAERLASDLRQADLPKVVRHVDAMVTTATDTMNHVDQIVQGSRSHLNSTLSDLPAIAGGLKSTVARADELLHDKRLDRTLGNVADDSANAGRTLDDLQRTSRDLQTLIATRQEDIQRIIADLRRTADNLASLSSDVRDNPSRLLLGGPPARREPGE